MKTKKITLKELRELESLTQRDFAELLNIAYPNYNKLETGKAKPSFTTLQKIISILKKHNLTLDNLIIWCSRKQNIFLRSISKWKK